MLDWLKRMSATAVGRVLAYALLGNAGIGAIVIAVWADLQQASPLLQILIAICVLTLLGVLAFFLWAFFHSPAANGIFTPQHLRRFKLPYRKVSWDFDNYLGLGSGNGKPILIYAFHPKLRVNWGKGIKPLRAYIECQRTGQHRDLLIEAGNPYVKVHDIAFIPSHRWFQCQGWFREHAENSTDPLSKEDFLKMFPDFVFTFEYNGGSFSRFFPHDELTLLIDRFWSYSNRLPDDRPLVRTTS